MKDGDIESSRVFEPDLDESFGKMQRATPSRVPSKFGVCSSSCTIRMCVKNGRRTDDSLGSEREGVIGVRTQRSRRQQAHQSQQLLLIDCSP